MKRRSCEAPFCDRRTRSGASQKRRYIVSGEMAALTNLMCLGPAMRTVRRERFDVAEAGIFEATREHDMAVDPIPANDERGKPHPHLKRDPAFLRERGAWPVSPGGAQQFVESRAKCRRLSLVMGRKPVAAIPVRLIPVCKLAAAFRTTPHRRWIVRSAARCFVLRLRHHFS